MPITDKQRQSAYKYKAKNIKRVPLDMQITDFNRLSDAAKTAGIGVNSYIKQAIAEKMEREAYTLQAATPEG